MKFLNAIPPPIPTLCAHYIRSAYAHQTYHVYSINQILPLNNYAVINARKKRINKKKNIRKSYHDDTRLALNSMF